MLFDFWIIIIDELMCGIDVGIKCQIYVFICKLVDEGCSVIVISLEMIEVIGLFDWVLVMCEGCFVGEVQGDVMIEENIVCFVMGVGGEVV